MCSSSTWLQWMMQLPHACLSQPTGQDKQNRLPNKPVTFPLLRHRSSSQRSLAGSRRCIFSLRIFLRNSLHDRTLDEFWGFALRCFEVGCLSKHQKKTRCAFFARCLFGSEISFCWYVFFTSGMMNQHPFGFSFFNSNSDNNNEHRKERHENNGASERHVVKWSISWILQMDWSFRDLPTNDAVLVESVATKKISIKSWKSGNLAPKLEPWLPSPGFQWPFQGFVSIF